MQHNPFSPHSPAAPDAFVNRDREVELIFGHVGATQRGNIAVSGPLGIGKTSLLHYVADPGVGGQFGVGMPEYAIVYLDVHSVTPFSANRFWHRLARLLARQPELGIESAAHRLMEQGDVDVTDVEELLDGLSERGQVLVLLLDEFEWALQGDSAELQAESRNFLAQLASLTRRAPRVLSLVVATLEPLVEATRVIDTWRGSPFSTVFSTVTLKPLGPEDVERLVVRALQGSDVTFDGPDRQLLFTVSGGHPAAVQAGAFALYHYRSQGMVGDGPRDAVRTAAVAALQPARSEAAPTAAPAPRPTAQVLTGKPRLTIDSDAGEVSIDGRRMPALTALEYSMLRLLFDSPGRLCSKEEIIRHVWGAEVEDEVDDSRVEKLISRLRRKIEPAPSRPKFIRTVRGRGYRLVP
jgi:hypothetical protein